MSTNMTIFKSPEYSCLRIYNVGDVKVINWICTCSKLIFQPKSNKHRTKTGNQKHLTKTGNQNIQSHVANTTKSQNKQNKIENMWKSLIN